VPNYDAGTTGTAGTSGGTAGRTGAGGSTSTGSGGGGGGKITPASGCRCGAVPLPGGAGWAALLACAALLARRRSR
jgi:hypothetical protein